ncbi:hypothetical protein GJ744_007631 [Endocarpon pusillum]|uniref:Uncharacterized protein n=1 Tax=Endocarpon pusillum TaxID=364733 RepID=A0A8H7E639_9EURO|nr:hypothetical protein GJ744_007631 [Endocarpon pusillum]
MQSAAGNPISGIPRPRFRPRRYQCLTGSNRHSSLADTQARPASRRGRSGGKIEVAPGEAKKGRTFTDRLSVWEQVVYQIWEMTRTKR